MPQEKTLFITASTIAAYEAGVEAERRKIHEELLAPIFAAYAQVKLDTPRILAVAIGNARVRFDMSTPAQRAVASGLLQHDHDERGPRVEP